MEDTELSPVFLLVNKQHEMDFSVHCKKKKKKEKTFWIFPLTLAIFLFHSFFIRTPLADGNSCWVSVWVAKHVEGGNNHKCNQVGNTVTDSETGFPLYRFNGILQKY